MNELKKEFMVVEKKLEKFFDIQEVWPLKHKIVECLSLYNEVFTGSHTGINDVFCEHIKCNRKKERRTWKLHPTHGAEKIKAWRFLDDDGKRDSYGY